MSDRVPHLWAVGQPSMIAWCDRHGLDATKIIACDFDAEPDKGGYKVTYREFHGVDEYGDVMRGPVKTLHTAEAPPRYGQ